MNLAKKKNMPEAVMMSGTINGEIMMAIISFRNGMMGRLSPSAAKIPSVVASKVAITPMKRLFLAPIFQLSLQTVVIPGSEQSPIMIRYQRNEKASGSRRSISGVNCGKGDTLNEIGITATRGMTRKNSTSVQMTR